MFKFLNHTLRSKIKAHLLLCVIILKQYRVCELALKLTQQHKHYFKPLLTFDLKSNQIIFFNSNQFDYYACMY